MADETLKTFKAYEKDIEKMTRMYGAPQWRAFRLALGNADCKHPEGMRTYTTALIPAPGEDAITKEAFKASGFRCKACGHYVFPTDPRIEDEYDSES